MSPRALVERQAKIFYGWWVILAAAIIHAMGGGFYAYGFTTLFLPISTGLGLTRTATSAVFSIARLEGGIEGPVAGWMIDRFGARKLLVIGLLFFGAGYILMHWMNSFLMFVILYAGVISIGHNTGFGHAVYALTNKWFIKNSSKATGFVSMAFGLGGAVIVPILGWLIIQYGWPTAVVVAGVTVLVIGLPLCLIVRSTPEEKGLLPDGERVEAKEVAQKPSVSAGEVDFTVRGAITTPAFWILSLAFSMRMFVQGAIWVHMVPMLVAGGFDEQGAANAIGLLLIFSIPVRLGFGWLGDIFLKRYLLAICCLINTVSLIVLLTAQSLWQLYLFVIIFALGYGAAPLNVSIVGEYFGRKKFATIRGITTLIRAVGHISGPIFAGYIYDVTQSYQVAFITFIVLYFLAAIVFFLARHPKPLVEVTGDTTSSP